MTDKQAIREALINEKKELLAQLDLGEGMARGIGMKDNTAELSVADNHPADMGSEAFERSKDFSISEKQLSFLRNIEDALKKLNSGNYGLCERCGLHIMEERLEAIPYVRFCLRCQEAEERKSPGDRPVEEDLLEPPFERDTVSESPGQDAEDFWQEVAQHNKRPKIFEDGLEDEETGKVESTDDISNEEFRRQYD